MLVRACGACFYPAPCVNAFPFCEQYIAGGSRAEGACIIYIWTVEGHLVTRLEGPNLGLLSLARHPVRPFLAAALTNGKVKLVVAVGFWRLWQLL